MKSIGLPKTENEHEKYCTYVLGSILIRERGNPRAWDASAFVAESVCEFQYMFRKMDHYFLADGVAEFCASSVPDVDPSYYAALPLIEECQAWCKKGKLPGGIIVHFPARERQRSVVIVPRFKYSLSGEFCYSYDFVASDGEDVLLINRNNKAVFDNGGDDSTNWLARFCLGFSMYIDAFPETISDASPAEIKHSKWYGGRMVGVGRSRYIEDDASGSVSPHWRRGHFRVLHSEKFKHKMGQTVFVSGSFVKGSAFDVSGDAP